jgi:DNA-binding CsgD family transcriptional regulator
MAAAPPGHVQRTADRLAGAGDAPPLAVLVAADGTGRTETLDALVAVLDARSIGSVAVAGRRADRDVAFGALLPTIDQPPAKPTRRSVRSSLAETLAGTGRVLVVDDGHLLDADSADVLLGLVDDARAGGIGIVVALSPTLPGSDDPLTAALARTGTVVRPEPLDDDDVAERAERILGTAPDSAVVELALTRAVGHARITDRLVAAWRDNGSIDRGAFIADPDPTPDAVADTISASAAELTPEAHAALTALALGPALDDELLTALSSGAARPGRSAPEIWQELRAAGLLVPGHEEPLPVVADAVAGRLDPAGRRDLQRRIAELLQARGAPASQIADHLVAAEARGPDVAEVLVSAGEAQLGEAPAVASEMLALAVEAGADATSVAGARAEAAALGGDEDSAIALADGAAGGPTASTARAELVLAGVLARRGLWARAQRSYDSIVGHPLLPDDAMRSLGSVPRAALGRSNGDQQAASEARPGAIAADVARVLGAAATAAAAGDAPLARRRAGEAAELVEAAGTPVVLPETPHALAALVALATGDSDDAERMAARALSAQVGGPAAARRHALIGGLAAMRAGRWDRAQHALDSADGPCTTRDAVIRGALAASLARRVGDVARLVEAWESIVAPVSAVHGDLFLLLPLAELVVVAARLGRRDAIAAREAELDEVLDGLGRPGLWSRPLAWARVEAAVAADDHDGLDRAVAALSDCAPADARVGGLDDAAAAWQRVLAGDAGGLDAGVAGLERAGLVWEASRLVGQAAIRAVDPGETRSLLGRARDLKGTLPVLDKSGAPTGTVLSAREQEVAACVVDGLTHKEIGAMLFISPKTVEHHVARIRQKLGATTRAELLAGLRATLAAT